MATTATVEGERKMMPDFVVGIIAIIVGAIVVTLTVKLIELVQHTDAVRSLGERFASLDLNALRMMIYAAVLIALMIKRPEGILGEREGWA